MHNGTDKRLFWLKRDNDGTNRDTPHASAGINPIDELVSGTHCFKHENKQISMQPSLSLAYRPIVAVFVASIGLQCRPK